MSIHLKKHFTIIVATVVVENGNVLMMQEAKPECLGLWYLPAGRLEKHESLTEGARRECKEETGLEVDMVAVLCVETTSSGWIRVNFVGKVTGGQLKRVPDKESLSADWVPLDVVMGMDNKLWPLRADDIVSVLRYWAHRGHSRAGLLPSVVPHVAIEYQVYWTVADSLMLVDLGTGFAPILVGEPRDSVHQRLALFYQASFHSVPYSRPPSFVLLGIEFAGTKRHARAITDGLLLQLWIRLEAPHLLADGVSLEWRHRSSDTDHPSMAEALATELPQLLVLC